MLNRKLDFELLLRKQRIHFALYTFLRLITSTELSIKFPALHALSHLVHIYPLMKVIGL